eukprot:CAMPEP_0115338454 /NCGR_PEP_ID=MMETSP0270-20121206/90081_1 /TAXON_ID=71861 /ORGANISM="Scrippsiella trochoidea, Strain CCMP3099" /LENGTH=83 /DNA_ID=CAMNT_0002759761 /DNA_START=326 /DNA_END=577 /DNA_ORIENTATION=+
MRRHAGPRNLAMGGALQIQFGIRLQVRNLITESTAALSRTNTNSQRRACSGALVLEGGSSERERRRDGESEKQGLSPTPPSSG